MITTPTRASINARPLISSDTLFLVVCLGLFLVPDVEVFVVVLGFGLTTGAAGRGGGIGVGTSGIGILPAPLQDQQVSCTGVLERPLPLQPMQGK